MDTTEARIYTAIIITAIVLGVIILYFIITVIASQRKNLRLHKQYMLAEISALEKERARIAADLHDELGPLLSAIKMRINSFELTNNSDIIQVTKTNNHIDAAIKRMREISFDLLPNSLLRKGLITAVKEFIDYLQSNNNIHFEYRFGQDFEIPEEISIHLYRVIQEIIHNVVKHSDASYVIIEITNHAKKKSIVISDNGKGFEYSRVVKDNQGMGLKSILSRSRIIGAETRLETSLGKGTSYIIHLPSNL